MIELKIKLNEAHDYWEKLDFQLTKMSTSWIALYEKRKKARKRWLSLHVKFYKNNKKSNPK